MPKAGAQRALPPIVSAAFIVVGVVLIAGGVALSAMDPAEAAKYSGDHVVRLLTGRDYGYVVAMLTAGAVFAWMGIRELVRARQTKTK